MFLSTLQPASVSLILPGARTVVPELCPVREDSDILIGDEEGQAQAAQQAQACRPTGLRFAQDPPPGDEHVLLTALPCPRAEAVDCIARLRCLRSRLAHRATIAGTVR